MKTEKYMQNNAKNTPDSVLSSLLEMQECGTISKEEFETVEAIIMKGKKTKSRNSLKITD